jgi:hypothetical protein
MTQEAIVLRTSGDAYPGLAVIQDINKALATIATDFAGPDDPAAKAFAYCTWADTGNMLLKRRNAANTAWAIAARLFPQLVEEENGDVTAAGDVSSDTVSLNDLDASLGSTILYPNGGSAASPANVSVNSRYVLANPFPGYRVFCDAQLYINGKWGSPGITFAYTSNLLVYGIRACQLDDADIIVQTARDSFARNSAADQLYPWPDLGAGVATPTPCRVLVWKLKGAI